MNKKRHFSTEEARSIGTQLKIEWSQIDLEQFRRGLEVELEHGAIDPETNVTGSAGGKSLIWAILHCT